MPSAVLVIADVLESGRRLVEEVLRPAGFLATLDDGASPPGDVILVDVSRLLGSPLAGLRARRETGDTAPAILLSVRLTEQIAADLFRLGVREYLVKPTDPGALGAAIEAVAESVRADRAREAPLAQLQVANENLRRRVEEMRTIASIGQTVAALHDLDPVLTHIVEAATYLTGAEEGGLYLAEPHTQELVLRASRDPGQVYASGMSLRVEDTIAGQVYRTGQPVLRKRAGADESLKVKTGYFVRALINVPLSIKGNPVGVLGVYNRSVERGFEDQHVEILAALADWASVAIENAQLVSHLEASLTATQQEVERLTIAVERPAADLIPPTFAVGLKEITTEADALLAAVFGPLEADQADSLQRIRRRAEELRQEVLRVTTGNLPSDTPADGESETAPPTGIGPAEVIENAVASLRAEAEARGLTLTSDVSGQFPGISAPLPRLRRMVHSLLTYSLLRARRGGVALTAYHFRVRGGVADTPFPLPAEVQFNSGPWLAVSIGDSGEALGEEALLALLAPEPTRPGARAAVDLSPAQVRRMAESLGGKLWAESGAREGLTLTLALPGK